MRSKRGYGVEVAVLLKEYKMLTSEITHYIIQEVCLRQGDASIPKSQTRIDAEKRQEDIVAILNEITDGKDIDQVLNRVAS